MQDLFDEIASPAEREAPGIEEASVGESRVLAEDPVEGDSETMIEEIAVSSGESPEAPKTEEAAEQAGGGEAVKPAASGPEKKAPKELPKQVNVVEEDPYEFEKCLVSIGIGLLPDDGHPDGRPVMLGVRNHQDEPLIRMCRLNDLMPFPDQIQSLLEKLREDLPARSARAAEKKTKAEETKKRAASRPKPAVKTAKPGKAKSGATSLNLFEMFDQ